MSFTRRGLLTAGAAAGASVALSQLDRHAALLDALAAAPRAGKLSDIEHVVILVQENRSFDCYFGTHRGGRGFGDPHALKQADGRPVFAQPGFDRSGFGGHLYPFHLDTQAGGECTHDVTHDWGPQHRSWNAGQMDGFVREHVKAEGPNHGPATMGYYKRSDLPFYYALADAFTLCDSYFCSMLGPTDPNQAMLVSGTIDPDGKHGGPLLSTVNRVPGTLGTLSWTTMPEQLQARGIGWRVYASPDNYVSQLADTPFPLFRQYYTRPELALNALVPTFPGSFELDVASGALPAVSWVYASPIMSEHSPAPVSWGEWAASHVLSTLTSNPAIWAKTVLFITWDENGGYFDHVPPPVAPPGTPGEHVTVRPLPPEAQGIAGPIGLGFRVPLLVVSPFSRGGFTCSQTYDHTSLLRFIETRFGAEVPNLSAWRRATVGDLAGTLNLSAPDTTVPALPATTLVDPRVLAGDCPTFAPVSLTPLGASLPPYPVPPNAMPSQEPGAARRPSGCPAPVAKPKHRKKKRRRKKRKRRHARHHRRH